MTLKLDEKQPAHKQEGEESLQTRSCMLNKQLIICRNLCRKLEKFCETFQKI